MDKITKSQSNSVREITEIFSALPGVHNPRFSQTMDKNVVCLSVSFKDAKETRTDTVQWRIGPYGGRYRVLDSRAKKSSKAELERIEAKETEDAIRLVGESERMSAEEQLSYLRENLTTETIPSRIVRLKAEIRELEATVRGRRIMAIFDSVTRARMGPWHELGTIQSDRGQRGQRPERQGQRREYQR